MSRQREAEAHAEMKAGEEVVRRVQDEARVRVDVKRARRMLERRILALDTLTEDEELRAIVQRALTSSDSVAVLTDASRAIQSQKEPLDTLITKWGEEEDARR